MTTTEETPLIPVDGEGFIAVDGQEAEFATPPKRTPALPLPRAPTFNRNASPGAAAPPPVTPVQRGKKAFENPTCSECRFEVKKDSELKDGRCIVCNQFLEITELKAQIEELHKQLDAKKKKARTLMKVVQMIVQ